MKILCNISSVYFFLDLFSIYKTQVGIPMASVSSTTIHIPEPFKKVLVYQGGGALGAYQLGVFRALHEKNIAPDWVIGTSIGAINGGIIAGNPPELRLKKLQEFWHILQDNNRQMAAGNKSLFNFMTVSYGVKGFFTPSFSQWINPNQNLGIEKAAYYSTEPLKNTLEDLIDIDYLNSKKVRFTVGAVNANSGVMRYFDSYKEPIFLEHILASGALPPAFPAIRIDGEPYWDGGIFSNTPIEAVLDDHPRNSSIIFSVQLWNPMSDEPRTINQVLSKQKDIQFSSRDHFLDKEKNLHRLRHTIHQLTTHLTNTQKNNPQIKELMSWGCDSVMHIIHLTINRIEGEDQYKDIDFSTLGIDYRSETGYQEASRALQSEIWNAPHDPNEGLHIHSQFR
jgi:NTE family protein